MIRWVIFIVVYLLLTIYGFQAIRTITKVTWIHVLFFILAVLVFGNFIYQFTLPSQGRVLTPGKSYAFGFLLTYMSFLLVMIPILIGEDIFRGVSSLYDRFFTTKEDFYFPERRKFISQVAMGLAAIPVASLLYGMYKGKYNFRVIKHTLFFEDLPQGFEGYKITQISDIHSGSFTDYEEIQQAVHMINSQESDAIMFTGDLVNNMAIEMDRWKPLFGCLKAKDGVFSVLGNHDYGDYVEWESNEAKHQNLEDLKRVHKDMGYDLLLNESRYLERNGDKIALVGVENWGRGGFTKKGDLTKASEGVKPDDFKILMSHDPSHWEDVVLHDPYHYHLTLSGHTHGMQFGVEIPGWVKWSPIKWRYKYWAGVYNELGQYINVNRGLGYLGYPGRAGIWPEITVIELKRKEQNS